MTESTGPDTPGQVFVYDIHETKYPYVQIKDNLFNPILTKIRRGIANFNPFAYPQIPSQDRMAFGLRHGNQFYSPDVYPNAIHFNNMFPTHYDPLANVTRPDQKFQIMSYAPGQHSQMVLTAEKLPRACIRTVQYYKRCTMINGTEKCAQEANNIVEICPNWALEAMKEKNRWVAKVEAIQNNQYHAAMRLSSYNEGRTAADVADKTWVHGTRKFLRPDTMWADERYSKITQAEINEAKVRVADRDTKKKEHAKGHHKGHDDHHGHEHAHNYDQVAHKQPRAMYP